jgi:hypothetical protein
MCDIGVFLRSLTCEHYLFKITKSWVKRAFSDSLLLNLSHNWETAPLLLQLSTNDNKQIFLRGKI